MQKITFLNWIATIAFVGVLFVNALAILQPLNGLTTGQVSNIYPALFRPAGVTFSIWGVIYLLLAGFIVLSWLRQDSFPGLLNYYGTQKLDPVSSLRNE